MSSAVAGRLNVVPHEQRSTLRNPAIDALDVLVGEWKLSLSDAWFLESGDVRQHGHATARWLGEAFVELVADFEGEPTWHFVFGRSDANEQLIALYHDPRPTSRVFHMTYAEGEWRYLAEGLRPDLGPGDQPLTKTAVEEDREEREAPDVNARLPGAPDQQGAGHR